MIRPAVRSPPPPPTRNPSSTPTRHVTQSPTHPVVHQPPTPIQVPQENGASQKDISKSEHTPSGATTKANDVPAHTNQSPTSSCPPVIPTRPYMPPRPFPPRPNSGSKRVPAKPKKSPHQPGRRVVKTQTAMALSSKKRSHDRATVSHSPTPPVKSPVPQSHDSTDNRAVMESVEVSQVEVDACVPKDPNTPTLSITDHDVVQFGFPSDELSPTSPNYASSFPATVDVSSSLPAKMPHMVRESSLEGLTEERTDEVRLTCYIHLYS